MKRYKYGLARKDGTYTLVDYDIPDSVDPYSFAGELRDMLNDPEVVGVFLADSDVAPVSNEETTGVKVPVYDVVRTRKMVELPKKCPKCGCEVLGNPLLVWEHQDQSRTAVVNSEGDVEWDDPRFGECSYEIAWLCGSCDHSLVEGEELLEVDPCDER